MVCTYVVEYSPVKELEETIQTDFTRRPHRGGENEAHRIERHQQEDNAPTIGMRVYRCTYTDDEDDAKWKKFMAILRSATKDGFECRNALDVHERFEWDVHEDKTFEGASVDAVREHFKQWAQQEVEKDGMAPICYATRYNFCLYIDKECLDSVLKASETDDGLLRGGYVNVIAARRYAGGPQPIVVRSPVLGLVPSTYCRLADAPGWDAVCRQGTWVWEDYPL